MVKNKVRAKSPKPWYERKTINVESRQVSKNRKGSSSANCTMQSKNSSKDESPTDEVKSVQSDALNSRRHYGKRKFKSRTSEEVCKFFFTIDLL